MVADVLTPPRSTGRVPHPVRAVLLVLEGLWTWYRRNWRSTAVSSVLLPLFSLLALGFGFGSQVHPSAMTGGLRYVEYLAPALLVTAAVQNAAGESTYPILASFKWARTYWGVSSTPITPSQLASGHLLFISIRLFTSGAAYLVVAAVFGALTSSAVLLSLLFATLTGMAFGAPLVAYSASVNDDGQSFNAVFRFVVMPMTLFAGTFYPVNELPSWARPVAWLTPLWHGNELARGAAFGTLRLLPTLGHLIYLGALLTAGVLMARRLYRRRLTV